VTYRYSTGHGVPLSGLEEVDLTLGEGRFIAVLGAPGSGKSTLLQHFNGILRPTAGRIRVLDFILDADEKARSLRPLRKRVGLVFQFPEQQLFEETIGKDIAFGPLNFGATGEEAKASAERAVRDVGLAPSVLDRNPFQLSGGQRRLAAIATVLASDPDVFVLDEPTASLDQTSRERVMKLLRRLCSDKGKTIVVVTHRLEEVMPYADDYVVMKDGRVIYSGPPGPLFRSAETANAAGLVLPRSLRFLILFAERFQAPPFEGPYTDACIAEYVERTMALKKRRRPADEDESSEGEGADAACWTK